MKKLWLLLAFASAGSLTKVNINTATVDELMLLKGLGENKAAAIVDYRTQHGLFNNLADLKKVKGIGDKIFDKLKDDLVLEGKTTFDDVNPNNLKTK